MASVFPVEGEQRAGLHGSLRDPRLSIGSPRLDMLFFWGAPLFAMLFVCLWLGAASLVPPRLQDAAIATLVAGVGILTFAHLIAVVPRAYFNRDVFASNAKRLTIVPLVLIAALFVSPTLLVCAAVVSVFWDVHHSAMQTFGLSRIYDMKAGNKPLELRATDLRLNWALYVGPIAAGASLAAHVGHFSKFGQLDWSLMTSVPGVIQSHSSAISWMAIAAWLAIAAWAAVDYAAAARRGYRLSAHKAALLGSTAAVSIAAWGFSPPLIAFAIINLFHAVQYFALVWLKEGTRIRERTARMIARGDGATVPATLGMAAFLILCTAFGVAYYLFEDARLLVAPFIACSLLHFWYDSFVWSVRKKQV